MRCRGGRRARRCRCLGGARLRRFRQPSRARRQAFARRAGSRGGRGADALARVSQGVRRAAAQGGVRYAAGDGAHAQARAPAVVVRAGAAPGSRDARRRFREGGQGAGRPAVRRGGGRLANIPCRSDERKRNRASPERADRAREQVVPAPSRRLLGDVGARRGGVRRPRLSARRRRDARRRQGSGHDGAGGACGLAGALVAWANAMGAARAARGGGKAALEGAEGRSRGGERERGWPLWRRARAPAPPTRSRAAFSTATRATL